MSQPTPWRFDRGEIYDGEGNRVLLDGFALGGGVSRENDRLIVDAVNSHAVLLKKIDQLKYRISELEARK